MSYTTYLFDFDYTLADSSRGIVTCFRNVLTRHGYMTVTDDEIKRTIGKTLEESFSILTGVTDSELLASFRQEYSKEADEHMTVNTVLFLETKSVLVALRDAGARIGIISTKYRYRINELLSQHFPENFMDIIIGGEDVKTPKPSPEGLLLAIKQLHTTKAETLYIGDSTIDAETAQNAGVDFAGVTHGVTTAQELNKYPHWKIMSSLEELLENKDEAPSNGWPEESPTPDNDLPAYRSRKLINIWQILLLVILLWLSYNELGSIESFLFIFTFFVALWNILQKRRLLPQKIETLIAPRWISYEERLHAFHLKLVKGKEAPSISDEACTCLNCGTTYVGNFCNRCGQSSRTTRYRFSNALKNIAGGFTNIDNGFGRTLIDLLCRPGHMIRDFIGGKRASYFRPFQTLFILAALYIMAVQLVDPDALRKKEKNITQTEITTAMQKEMQGADMEDANVLSDVIKGFSSMNTSQSIFEEIPFVQKVTNLLKSWVHGNKAFQIIATLPFFAFATFLSYRSKRNKLYYNPTEHIFIQAYIACQILLISILILPFNGEAKVNDLYEVPIWFIFALFWLDYKQLFNSTWWKSFRRTVLMFFYSFLLIILFATLIVALAITVGYIFSN